MKLESLYFNLNEGFFWDKTGKQFALIETKSSKLTVKNLHEFVHVLDKQKAALDLCLLEENVIKEMIKTAKEAGTIKIDEVEFPTDRIQIITIEELVRGKQPILPVLRTTKLLRKQNGMKIRL